MSSTIPPKPMKAKAILFDLDGVIIDSLDAWWHALNDTFKKFDLKEISREEFVSKYWGYDLYTNLKKANLPIEVGITCSRLYKNHLDKIKLHPKAFEILERTKDLKKGLVTNTPRDCIKEVLKRFNLEGYFDVIVTGDDVSRGKPNPEIIFKACNYLGVDPEEVIMIGDTDSDMKAAKLAGCPAVGIGIKGDITIKDLSELLDILDM